MQLKPNTELQNGKYKILKVLGQGGFGITYLAEHTMLDKYVAIKEFFPKEYCDREETTSQVTLGSKNTTDLVGALKNKFVKEAKNISKLRHTNIITIHDIFEENSTAYYVMEFIEGKSLSDKLKNSGPISEEEAVNYVLKIADAVGYMHSLSMNHLDLKPANIMLRKEDNEPILIDFGLSKQYDASGGQTSTTPIGISHGYAPIEQYRPGGVAIFTPQTDIYALGATLYALLSGNTPPHYSEILEEGLPELPSNISNKTKEAVEHAMEIKKNKRPETIQQLVKELSGDDEKKVSSSQEERTPIKEENTVVIPENNLEIKDKAKPESSKDIIEETVVLKKEEPIENKLNQKVQSLTNEEICISVEEKSDFKDIKIGDIEFVDLGLSIRWANKNIGAKSVADCGISINSAHSDETQEVYEYNFKGAKIPTIGQWEELRNNCPWEWSQKDGKDGYKVIGRNGNSIFLPFNDESETIFKSAFGRLYTRETFYKGKNNNSDNYYFYYANGGIYKLTSYSLNYSCPVRLIF